jgi:hypothetical protein
MADLLMTGTIVDANGDATSWKIVEVVNGQQKVFAYFRELQGTEPAVPELAAYKLDRLLGLGMVPATVRREIGGQQGILQYVFVVRLAVSRESCSMFLRTLSPSDTVPRAGEAETRPVPLRSKSP